MQVMTDKEGPGPQDKISTLMAAASSGAVELLQLLLAGGRPLPQLTAIRLCPAPHAMVFARESALLAASLGLEDGQLRRYDTAAL